MAELNLATRALTLSDSGYPYPYHFQAETGDLVELPLDSYPLGVRIDTEYLVLETRLRPNDCVVFCSDGIIEAQNAAREQFGYDRTAEMLQRICKANLSARATIDGILEEVDSFRGGASQVDDMTCVVLRVV
jgi:sigma-B regulation protein RsbU (phosphoserine phosphatase)